MDASDLSRIEADLDAAWMVWRTGGDVVHDAFCQRASLLIGFQNDGDAQTAANLCTLSSARFTAVASFRRFREVCRRLGPNDYDFACARVAKQARNTFARVRHNQQIPPLDRHGLPQ